MSTEVFHIPTPTISKEELSEACEVIASGSGYYNPEEIKQAYENREHHLMNEANEFRYTRRIANWSFGAAIISTPVALNSSIYAVRDKDSSALDPVTIPIALLSSFAAVSCYKLSQAVQKRVKYAVDKSQSAAQNILKP